MERSPNGNASVHGDSPPPRFDAAFATRLIGKRVLIGVTVKTRDGEVVRNEQFHGEVVSADPADGIRLALHGRRAGETKWLPAATDAFRAADEGTYTLRGTGEEVVDPDFTAQWVLYEAEPG